MKKGCFQKEKQAEIIKIYLQATYKTPLEEKINQQETQKE
jgi:hypothetical protein